MHRRSTAASSNNFVFAREGRGRSERAGTNKTAERERVVGRIAGSIDSVREYTWIADRAAIDQGEWHPDAWR